MCSGLDGAGWAQGCWAARGCWRGAGIWVRRSWCHTARPRWGRAGGIDHGCGYPNLGVCRTGLSQFRGLEDSEQLGGCPWPWLSPHLLLGAMAPRGWLPGATLLALGCLIPALWLTSCVSAPAPCCLHPVPIADLEAEPGEASTDLVALGETDRPCLTGALTGEAFPLQTDSLAAQTFLCPAERSIGCGPAWCLPLPPVIAPALAPPAPPRLPLRWAAAWC